jgi:hypothetical protein
MQRIRYPRQRLAFTLAFASSSRTTPKPSPRSIHAVSWTLQDNSDSEVPGLALVVDSQHAGIISLSEYVQQLVAKPTRQVCGVQVLFALDALYLEIGLFACKTSPTRQKSHSPLPYHGHVNSANQSPSVKAISIEN